MVRDNLVAAEFRGMAETKRIAHAVRRQAIRRKAQRRHSHFYDRCAHWTFNRNASHEPLKWHRERWILGGLALLVVVLSGLVIPAWAGAMRTNPVPPVHALLPLRLPTVIDTPAPPKALSEEWRSVQVQPGQTLSDIFQSQGLTLTDLQHVMDASDNSRALHHISVGQEFQFLIGDQNKLAGIRFDQDENSRATLRLDGAIKEQAVRRAQGDGTGIAPDRLRRKVLACNTAWVLKFVEYRRSAGYIDDRAGFSHQITSIIGQNDRTSVQHLTSNGRLQNAVDENLFAVRID